jgi:L-cysteine desulfidase
MRHRKPRFFPPLISTQPIAATYAATVTAAEAGGALEKPELTVDAGDHKNALALTAPPTCRR